MRIVLALDLYHISLAMSCFECEVLDQCLKNEFDLFLFKNPPFFIAKNNKIN